MNLTKYTQEMEKNFKGIQALEKNFGTKQLDDSTRILLYRVVALCDKRGIALSYLNQEAFDSLVGLIATRDKGLPFPFKLLPSICDDLKISMVTFFDFPPYNEVDK